jgi:hypothetical protein
MSNDYSIWTTNDDPAWLRINVGNTMMRLAANLSLDNAQRIMARLEERYGDTELAVWDAHDQPVTNVSRETTGPKRRALSKREG